MHAPRRAQDDAGNTGLMLAIMDGDLGMVEWLLRCVIGQRSEKGGIMQTVVLNSLFSTCGCSRLCVRVCAHAPRGLSLQQRG